ncbi:stage III sporulation protein AE [Clostridium thailandense]|uniref:Stage III sporulation protein AE n=1 Tax=Clostridium thailandense TaxID=2794346 RepID=A0A949X549_9CLOT|nr:stage III sporulation protein AE [Clostridium thailandense]MBV7275058.1 stage III sporulation protein AE [Clostridium thailandense]MCH5136572.1 stage III sporulation protein AE [Clostridiaceae bacterium UIB06]
MRKIILILLMIFVTSTNVKALEANNIPINSQDKIETEQIERFYDYISNMKTKYELLKDLDVKTYVQGFIKSGDGKVSTKKIVNALGLYIVKEVAASLKLLALLVVIALICSLLTNLQKAFSGEGLSNIAYFACYSLLIIIMARSFYIGVDTARSTMKDMTDFMTAIIPILIMLIASVGGFVEAALMDPVIIGAITISGKIFMDIIIPIICMTFVLQFVNNMSEEYKIDKLTKLLNQVAMWGQGIVITIFIGIITIRGISSKTIDEVTAKTAKFAVDNFVPIVGKSLSDAISTVAGYSILLKNALSSLGLVVLIAIVLFPIIKLLIMSLLYKLTAALIEPISDSRLVNCISSAGDSLVLVTACLISVSVMFFIMVAIIASAGKVMIGG